MDSVEEYERRWAKKEDVEVDTLSEWVKSVMSLVNRRVPVLSRNMSSRHESVFDDPDVAAELAEIHEKVVVVPADKASNRPLASYGLFMGNFVDHVFLKAYYLASILQQFSHLAMGA